MNTNKKQKSPRARLLSKLFIKAAETGISQEMVRENITFAVNGKRLSASTLTEIGRVIDHIKGAPRQRKYAPGIAGLRCEIRDLAMTRWEDGWEDSLNAFCKSFGVSHWRFLDITKGKAVKKRLQKIITTESAEGADAERR